MKNYLFLLLLSSFFLFPLQTLAGRVDPSQCTITTEPKCGTNYYSCQEGNPSNGNGTDWSCSFRDEVNPGCPAISCSYEKVNADYGPLNKFSNALFRWSQVAMIFIAGGIFIFAGIVYMTSAGNPNRVALAKRLVTGAVAALIVLFLGMFFLRMVIGVNI